MENVLLFLLVEVIVRTPELKKKYLSLNLDCFKIIFKNIFLLAIRASSID